MSDNPNYPGDKQTTPKTRTEPLRQRGGGGSGLPPNKTALGLEGSRNPPAGRVLNAFGIDFGEETSRIASLRNGIPFFVPPGVFPSAIGIDSSNQVKDDGHLVITGLRSKLRGSSDDFSPTEEIDHLVKRFFGRMHTHINNIVRIPQPKVVITVPAYYCSKERLQIVECAGLAEMRVLGLINDYAAVAHSFVNTKAARCGTMLILSIGAEAVSTAVVKVTGSLIETVTANSSPQFGGRCVIDAIASHLLHKSESVTTFDELPADKSSEWRDYAKELLLNHGQNNDSISVAAVDQPYVIQVPKPELLDILADSLKPAINSANELLKESGIARDQIDFMLIVGGIISYPIVAKFVAESFPRLRRMILNADRAPAFGAALRAGVLVDHIEAPLLWDVLTQSVYRTEGDSKLVIVSAGTSLPVTMHVAMSSPDCDVTQQRSGMNDISSGHLEQIRAEHDSSQPLTAELFINSDGIMTVCGQIESDQAAV